MINNDWKFEREPWWIYRLWIRIVLKILNKNSTKIENSNVKELFVDENWKINSKNMDDKIPSDNSNLKRILADIFPNKKIDVQDRNDGSQVILLS